MSLAKRCLLEPVPRTTSGNRRGGGLRDSTQCVKLLNCRASDVPAAPVARQWRTNALLQREPTGGSMRRALSTRQRMHALPERSRCAGVRVARLLQHGDRSCSRVLQTCERLRRLQLALQYRVRSRATTIERIKNFLRRRTYLRTDLPPSTRAPSVRVDSSVTIHCPEIRL